MHRTLHTLMRRPALRCSRAAEGRLIDTGGYTNKDGITHRIPISSVDEINGEVKKWLGIAYDGDV